MNTPKAISLIYELRTGSAQGELIETVNKNDPAIFLFGQGQLIKEFEDHIQKCAVGDTFEFVIKSENAYGPSNPEAIVSLSRSIFMHEGVEATDLLEIGKTIPMQNDQGHPLQGKVVELTDNMVKMDFNHPLAGFDLHFKGEVLHTRDATQAEIEHGHVHSGGHCH